MAINDLSVDLSLDTSTAIKDFNKFKQTIENKNNVSVNIKMNTGGADTKLTEISNILQQINTTITPKVKPNTDTKKLSEFKVMWDSIKDKQVKISAIGSGIENIGKSMESIFSFDSNSKLGKFMSFFTKGIGYSAIYRSVASFQSSLTSAMSEGVGQYDTINVAKRTLKVVAGDAQDQIDTVIGDLEKRIEGLPTTLSDALGHVSTFASINGDLTKSNKLFNAMNDAILSFGGSADDVNNAVTQYSQIMGSKMDSRTLLSLQSANMMPVLNAVAKQMNMSFTEFKEAFTGTDPTISLDQFEEALIKLDEEGGGGLDALSTMAKNSVMTITNAVNLLQIRLNKAVRSIAESMDNMIQKITGKTLYEIIDGWSQKILDKGNEIATWINNNQSVIEDALNNVKKTASDVWAVVSQFDIKEFVNGIMDLKPVVDGIVDVGKKLFTIIGKVMKSFGGGNTSRGLGKFVASWILLAKTFKIVGKNIQFVSPLLAILSTMDKFQFNGVGKLAKYLKAMKNPMDTLSGGSKAKNVAETFNMDAFKNMGMKHLDKIANIAEIAMIGGVILEWATVLKKVDKELDGVNGGDLALKLAGIASAIGAFELLFNATQVLAEGLSKVEGLTNPLTAKDKFIALAEMIVEGGIIYEFAYALGEFNKRVPSITSSDIAGKLASLGVAITELSALATAMGAITLTPLGLTSLIGLGEMFAEGGALYVFATSLGKFNKVNLTKSTTQIQKLKLILEGLSDFDISDVNMNTATLKSISEAMPYVVKISKSLSDLNGIENISASDINPKIASIGNVLKEIKWSKLKLANPIDSQNAEATSNALKTIASIPNAFKDLIGAMDGLDVSKLTGKDSIFDSLSKIIDELNGDVIITRLNEMGKNASNVSNAQTALSTLSSIVETLKDFASKMADVKPEDINNAVSSLTSILSNIGGQGIDNTLTFFVTSLSKVNKQFTNASSAITNLQTMAQTFSGIQDIKLNVRNIQDLITNISTCIKSMNALANNDIIANISEGELSTSLANASSYIDDYKSFITKLQELSKMTVDSGTLIELNNTINTSLNNMKLTETDELANSAENAKLFIEQYTSIVSQLQAIAQSQETINAIGTSLADSVVTGFVNANFQPIYDKIVEIANRIGSDTYKNLFKSVGNTLGKALSSGLKSGTSASGVVSKLISTLTSDETLSAVASSVSTIGKTIMNNIQDQIKTVTVKTETKNNSTGKKSKSSSTGGLVYRASGGAIGGVDWKRKGTDTVPTMLTPGEFVIRRNAVKKYGMSFFDRLNSMDIKGAIGVLRSGSNISNIGARTYNVVNNKTINNYDNRSVSIKGSDRGNGDRLKAGRFMRALA